jgi:hypothetical protein
VSALEQEQPIVVDLATLERQPFELRAHPTDTSFVLGQEARQIGRGTRGWIRRLAEPDWRQRDAPGTYGAVVRSAWINLLVAIAHGLDVDWLTPLDALNLAENKAFQLLEAQRLGIRTPATAVVSARDRLPPELGDPVVVKPLGPGAYRDEDGAMRVVHAHLVERGSDVLEALGGAPFLVQDRLEVEQHLRIVTVGQRTWCCRLDATGLPLDWRREEAAHDAFEPSMEYGDTERDATLLAQALRAGFSSQDWVVAANAVWFLDFNPGGQWLFLPAAVANEVTNAIADWLTEAR